METGVLSIALSAGSETVTAGAPNVTRAQGVEGANRIQIAITLIDFVNKVTGAIDVFPQESSDGQNWKSIGSISAAFDKAGTTQVAAFPIATRLYRVLISSSPTGNTVAYSMQVHLAHL